MRHRFPLFLMLAMGLVGVLLTAPGPAVAWKSQIHQRATAPPVSLLPPLPRIRLLAQHGRSVSPTPFFRSGFVLKADGYKVGVSTFGSAVFLEVWRGGNGKRVQTAYLARGVAAPERLKARFGQFGRVKMRFRESRNKTWRGQRRTCRGANRFIKRRGVFRGNLRFMGEGGYVTVRVHRAKGVVVTEAPKCRGQRRGGPGPNLPFPLAEPKSALLAISREGTDSAAVLAIDGRRSTQFVASSEDSRPKLAIIRMAAIRRPGRIRTDESLTEAFISPPAPFHGTGRYRAAADGSSTWSGSLSVNFPGAPRSALTGPSFESFLEVPF